MAHLLPPCTSACPVNTDVRGYLAAIAGRDYAKAYNLIKEHNPFPSVCAWICQHPCEDACRRGQVDEPVDIRGLKRFVVEKFEADGASPKAPVATGRKVAAVGSGPAGLTAAYDLARLGHKVTLYDRHKEPGGHFLASLPLFRLPRRVLRQDVGRIMAAGITFVPETEIGRDLSLAQLNQAYDAVIVSTGLWGSRGVGGFSHPAVWSALPFLAQANIGACSDLGRTVAVIGGGNVALDVARAAVRLGAARVTVFSLESRAELPASAWEVAEALEEGVILCPGYGPATVLTEGERLTGLKVQEVKQVYDQTGRFAPVFWADRFKTVPAETIILAIGQTPETDFLRGSSLALDPRGYLEPSQAELEAGRNGLFVAGEIATGPGPAIAAVASGHRAAEYVQRYLGGAPRRALAPEEQTIAPLPEETARRVTPKERWRTATAAPEQRARNFLPYRAGLDEAAAGWEARRCLSCGLGARVEQNKCAACLTCLRVCPYTAPEVGEAAQIAPEKCLACGVCAANCPAGAISLAAELLPETGAIPAAAGKITVFVCRGVSAVINLADLAATPGLGEKLYLVEIPTAGALPLEWILTALEHEAAAAAIIGCPPEQCRHPADRAGCQAVYQRAQNLLKQIGLPAESLQYLEAPGDLGAIRAWLTAALGS